MVTVLLILAGLFKRNNIYLSGITMLWIWVIMAFNYDGVDYSANEMIYNSMGNEGDEFNLISYLPNALMRVAHGIYLDYWEYNGLMVSVMLVLMFLWIKNNVHNHTAYLSIFMIYPMMDSVFQKRFFIAMIISVIALWYATNKKMVKYVVLTLISIGFHFTAIFTFLYVIIAWIREKSHVALVLMLIFEIVFLVQFREYILLVVAADNAKIDEYIGGNAISLFAGGLFVLTQIGFVWLTDLILRYNNDDERIKFIRNLNVSSLFFAPFLMMDAVFFRFYRIVMMLTYIYIADSIKGCFWCNNKHYYTAVIYLVLLTAWVYVVASFDKLGWPVFLQTLFKYNKVIELWM